MYGSSYGGVGGVGGVGGTYGSGLYGNNMYRGGYGGLYGGSMYGGGMGGMGGMYGGLGGVGGTMGGYGMGMGGPLGDQDPNNPYGPPSSPPNFWISLMRVVSRRLRLFHSDSLSLVLFCILNSQI